MRDKRIYTHRIAISKADLAFVKGQKKRVGNKKSDAGVLSYIINRYKEALILTIIK